MRKVVILIGVWCVVFSSVAQEKVLELGEVFEKKRSNKECYALPNQLNKNLVLLFEEGKQFYAQLLDQDYQEVSKVNAKTIPSKYRYILGYNIIGNRYSIFFSNSQNTKFGVQTFNFDTNISENTLLDFKIKGEKYVESIVHNNKIHLITITKKTSDLNIYTFDHDFKPTKHVVSLKEMEYPNPKNRNHTITAYYLLLSIAGDRSRSIIDVEKIEGSNPNVIETTSKENKLYQLDNQLIFSFDYDHKKTQLCFIDLEKFSAEVKSYDKPSKTEEGYSKSNSYIFDNKLFQIASSNQKMKFTVLDLTTEKIIKEYKVTKADSITFKNSPIIQEGGGMFPSFSENRVREMEKTSKYLRKISSSNLGISVYKVNDEYNVVLGGTKEIITNSGFVISGVGSGLGFGGTVDNGIWLSFNPTFYDYNTYTTAKSTYINCLFDSNFNHIKGDIRKNSYDILFEFEDELSDDIKAVNIFLHQNKLHYGFFDPNKKTYELFSFNR